MKTEGAARGRAWRLTKRFAVLTVLLVLAFIAWTHVTSGGGAFLNPVELLGCIAVIAAAMLIRDRKEGWAFAATTVTIAICIVTIFVYLYPRVMVSSTNPAYSLTVHNTASPPYTLKVMTVVAVLLLPVVIGYQAWTYCVFRKRLSDQQFRPKPPPTAVPATVPASQPPQRHGFGLPRGWRRLRGPRH